LVVVVEVVVEEGVGEVEEEEDKVQHLLMESQYLRLEFHGKLRRHSHRRRRLRSSRSHIV
jgi:hypothetical protein